MYDTDFREICVYKVGGGLEALIVFLGGFLADTVGGTELDVGFFEVGSDAGWNEERSVFLLPSRSSEWTSNVRVDGVAQDLTAAGVVEEDLVLLQGGEVRSDGVDLQLAVNKDLGHVSMLDGCLRSIMIGDFLWPLDSVRRLSQCSPHDVCWRAEGLQWPCIKGSGVIS